MADVFKQIAADSAAKKDSNDPAVTFWAKELDLAQKREERFRKDAKRIIKLYEGGKREDNSFNILYANTETLLPACYNKLPRPYVDRKFQDADPVGKQASVALERTLKALQDSGDAEYDPFNSLIEQAVLGALVPGRGLTKFRYDPKIEGSEEPVVNGKKKKGEGETAGEESGEVGEGEDVLPIPGAKVTYETICGEDVPHDRVLFGYARRWVKCPWMAIRHDMTKEDATESFGAKIADELTYAENQREDSNSYKSKNTEGEEEASESGSEPTCVVWEIWNKMTKEVVFYAPGYQEGIVKTVEDPYGLSGFYPCPEPLVFLLKRSGMTPTAMYLLYEEQAKELNRLSMRINRVLNALKVRGFYDGTMKGIQDILRADDNTFLPVKDVAALQDGKTLANSFTFMPLNDLVNVLQQLLMGREQCKNTIYEITGISDIMRGDTQASETFGAQKLKSQWGTQRLQRMQGYVQRYVRDCLRIMGELAGKHFGVETFAAMTNLDYATPDQVAQAQQIADQLNQQFQQLPPTPGPPDPQTGQPGPPGPPQPTPQMQQAMQQVQTVLAKPKWFDILALLQNDLQRNFRIDIETNSTIEANSQEDKQNVTEALGALSQMMQQFAPAVQSGAMPMATVKSIIMTVVRKFAFGREVEDAVSQMPDQMPPQPTDPSKAGPSQAEQQATQAEAQLDIATSQAKGQNLQLQTQLAQQKFAIDQAKMQRQEQMDQANHQLKMMQIQASIEETQGKAAATKLATQAAMAKDRMAVEEAANKAAMQKQAAAKAKQPVQPAAPDPIHGLMRDMIAQMQRPKRIRAVRDPMTNRISHLIAE